jgi:transposase
MLYIGIDAAKDKHDCCIVDSDGEFKCDGFTFANSKEGFEKFLEIVKQSLSSKDEIIKVGLESTGHYSTNLLSFLNSQGFEVVVFNPLSVNRSRTANSLRRTKTDKNDSRYIVQLLMSGNFKPYHKQSYHILRLKSLSRARFRLVKEIQPLKNRYRRLIHLLFPELQGFFCKLDIPAVITLLTALPGAKDIAACNIKKLANILSTASRGRFKRAKAEALKQLAKNSIAEYNQGDAFELKLTLQRIQFLESQKAEIEAEIRNVMGEIKSTVTSINGVGDILGAAILAEIGDIDTFSNSAKLLAFAGCEPSTYQSGKFTATNTPMVKHGSRYLRNALYLAVKSAYLHSPSFRAYIDRKRAQGKHYYTAMSHGIKKMVRVLFVVLKRNITFTEPI